MSLLLTSIVVTSSLAAAPTVIVAAATTSAPSSSSIACLLDAACHGSWKPGAADAGADEGIALTIAGLREQAVLLEVTVASKASSPPFHVSVSGRSAPLVSKDGLAWHTTKVFVRDTIFLRTVAGARDVDVRSIRILGGDDGKPLPLLLPLQVKATVSSSSVLAPSSTYQAAKLFDSRLEQAWATDGAKTSGKGVTVDVTFDAPQAINGVLLWNGYRRSQAHFDANSRIAALTVKAAGKAQSKSVDTNGFGSYETITFVEALPPSNKVQLVIDDVVAGEKYKDLVVSELRFVDKQGHVIEPLVTFEKPPPDPSIAPYLDRSYAGVVAAVGGSPRCSDRRMRLRSDGSFVFYTDAADDTDGIVEGNWAVKNAALKIFGKKYRTELVGEYAGMTETKPEIFESDLKVKPFADLSAKEKSTVVNAVLDSVAGASGNGRATTRGGVELAVEKTRPEMVTTLTAKLAEKKALAVLSSAYVDAVLPTDELGPCK